MDQKVGKVTGPEVVVRVGHLSRLPVSTVSLVSQGEMVCCSISPPKANSDFMLSTPDTASKIGSLMVFTGTSQYRRAPLGDDPLADFIAAAGHVPRPSVSAEGEREVSVVYAARYEMISFPMP